MSARARAHGVVVLAMSADGKIAAKERSPARFGSAADKLHLETQIAQADGVLFGAGTLRAYGTTLRITHPDLLEQRQQLGKPPQPVHIVCSSSGRLDPDYRFFQQAVPRWLLTGSAGAERWDDRPGFDRVLIALSPTASVPTHWHQVFQQLAALGLQKIVVTGGGQLVASLLEAGVIDEIWLTVCPLVLGGTQAPTPVEGWGFPENLAPRLELQSAQILDSEVFLHYHLQREKN